MKPFDEYDDYSLNMLSEWVKESMESPNTPQQVYETIVRTVREKRDYRQSCYKHSVKLLELLKGGMTPMPEHYDDFECPIPEQSVTSYGGTDTSPEALRNWEDFWHSPEKTGSWGSNYTKEEEREIELKEREYERKRAIHDAQTQANSPYNDGWTQEAYKKELDQIRKEGGYDWTPGT